MTITDDAFSTNRWCIPYKRTICFFIFLYQVCNPLFTVARQKVDNRNLNHCIATRLLTHCSTCHTYQHLRSKRRVIDAHVEFEQLVLCFSGNALTGQVYTVSHIKQCIYARNKFHMRFVIYKIWIGFDGGSYFVKFVTIVQFDVYHTAMYARTGRNRH